AGVENLGLVFVNATGSAGLLDMPITPYQIFLSHYSQEALVANYLKEEIERAFLGAVEIFVSSHAKSIQLGDEWEELVRTRLTDAELVLVLLSADSITRPWLNFESGGAWALHRRMIPLLHRGFTT